MRIVFVLTGFVTETPSNGGVAVLIDRVTRLLYARGHDIQVITLSMENEQQLDYNGITVHRVQPSRWVMRAVRLLKGRFHGPMVTGNFSWKAQQKIRQLHAEKPVDVIHLVNDEAVGFFVNRLAIPRVLLMTSFTPLTVEANQIPMSRSLKVQLWMVQKAVQGANFVYSCTHRIKTLTENNYHIEHVSVVRKPFSLQLPPIDPTTMDDYHLHDKPYALYFGRLEILKGMYTLAEALPRFLYAYPDARFVFVGRVLNGVHHTTMQEDIAELCREYLDRIIFIPEQPYFKLIPIIQGARVVVLPSYFDNFPYSGIETLGMKKAMIGTDGATFDELMTDGVNGFIVPAKNSDALAEKLISVWQRDDLDTIGEQAYQLVSTVFDPQKSIDDLLALYQRAITNA